MCSMEKASLASCEITYFPIKSEDYIGDINKVLKIIEAYPVEVTVGILSTTIRGNSQIIFQLIQEIYSNMAEEGRHFTISMMMSNICGCEA
ncbi:YKOF-related Family [Natronincola peptidivorans]|uniref:YKOF-related Family n=1 Tax=Natronincola peptidivorans TaxID=426128 RepID=A0A1I0A7B4_9FIRM|nr:YkoF family thiamine/hydroxymethylpyrimidine-binding protein [Natronincola peptidivorans]SES90047.1 YKOF-related Family [Natronincola peptidivorans]